MKDHGLDLAIIGNGRTAALVDPSSRIVWWCYPRFDSDPVFCRLLAGKEEKGFSDIVLDDLAEYQSEYVRNTTIVSTLLIPPTLVTGAFGMNVPGIPFEHSPAGFIGAAALCAGVVAAALFLLRRFGM